MGRGSTSAAEPSLSHWVWLLLIIIMIMILVDGRRRRRTLGRSERRMFRLVICLFCARVYLFECGFVCWFVCSSGRCSRISTGVITIIQLAICVLLLLVVVI